MQRTLFLVSALFCAASLRADVVTLPAAASIMGGSPFFSDARAFNTSYSSPLSVTATYRCFIATVACPATAPQIQFTLAPRESKAFNDICANAFGAPNTAGGVEFSFTGSEDQLVVTSRLYSTDPHDSVGMFIPGLEESKAAATTVLTSIRHDAAATPPTGFRTNVGAFNPGSSPVTVTFTIFDAGAQVGVAVSRSVSGHSGVQVSGIFEAAGANGLSTQNAVIVVSATTPVFSYAAVLDNRTTDPIFVVGAPDLPLQAVTAVPSPSPTPTPPAAQTLTVNVGQGGTYFIDQVSGTSTTTINVGDTVTWVWQGDLSHGTDSGGCTGGGGGYGGGYGGGCTSSGVFGSHVHMAPYSYSFTFTQAGTFHYFCDVHQDAMTGRVIVNAPAAASATRR